MGVSTKFFDSVSVDKNELPKAEKNLNSLSRFNGLIQKIAVGIFLVLGTVIGLKVAFLAMGTVAVLPLALGAAAGLILSAAILLIVAAVFKRVMKKKLEQINSFTPPLNNTSFANPIGSNSGISNGDSLLEKSPLNEDETTLNFKVEETKPPFEVTSPCGSSINQAPSSQAESSEKQTEYLNTSFSDHLINLPISTNTASEESLMTLFLNDDVQEMDCLISEVMSSTIEENTHLTVEFTDQKKKELEVIEEVVEQNALIIDSSGLNVSKNNLGVSDLINGFEWVEIDSSVNLENSFVKIPYPGPEDPTFGGDIEERSAFYLKRCNLLIQDEPTVIPDAVAIKNDLLRMLTDPVLAKSITLEPPLKLESHPPVNSIAEQFFKDLSRNSTILINGEVLYDAKLFQNANGDDINRLILTKMIEKLGPDLVSKISLWMQQALHSQTLIALHRLITQEESLVFRNIIGEQNYKINTIENKIILEGDCVLYVGDQYPCLNPDVFTERKEYKSANPVGYICVYKRIICSQEDLINDQTSLESSFRSDQIVSPFYRSVSETKAFVNGQIAQFAKDDNN